MALRVVTGFEFGTTAGWTIGPGGAKIVDIANGTPTITTSTPRTDTYALEISTSAAIEEIKWTTATLGTSQTRMRAVFHIRFVTSLPAADSVIAFSGVSGTSVEVRFVSATSKLRVQYESGGASQDSAGTVAADTWYRIEIYHDVNANPNTFDWWIDGTAQTQLSTAIAAGTIDQLSLGAYITATYTARYDDVVIYTDTAALTTVLGAHKVKKLIPDTGGSLDVATITTSEWNTFAGATPTLSAWNATTALGAVDEIPVGLGASADGFCRITGTDADYVGIPMTSYTLVAGETIAGLRMLACCWAASATACTHSFASYNGTTATSLFAAADVGTDNSATAPAWVCKMATLADFNTQGELDALQFRFGSTDSTPDAGIHGIYGELAITEAVSGDATATPAVVAGIAAVAGPAVSVGSTISASAVAGFTTISAPTAQGGAGTTPTVVTGTATIPTPGLSTGSTVSPTAVAGTTTIPTPTVTVGGDATATPAVVAGATSIPAPTINTGATATPTVVAGVATIPTPTVVVGGDATATPAVVAGTTAIATPTANVGSTVTPAVVSGTAVIPTPAAQGGVVVTLTTVAGVAAIATPTVTVGATVTPATVMTLATIPTPTVTALGVAGAGAPLLTSTAVARAGTTTTDVNALLTSTGR